MQLYNNYPKSTKTYNFKETFTFYYVEAQKIVFDANQRSHFVKRKSFVCNWFKKPICIISYARLVLVGTQA